MRAPWIPMFLVLGLLMACGGGEPSPPAAETVAGDDQEVIPGWWREYRPRPRAEMTPEQQAAIERLNAIGYVGGSQAPRDAQLVPIHDPDRAHPGLNFFVSGHGPHAYLVDMEGNLVHQWKKDFLEIWPDADVDPDNVNYDFFRRALLLPDGDVIAIFEGLAIFRMDRDSNVEWALHNQAHHDLEFLPDGNLLTLARTAHVVERIHPTEPILEDFFVVLTPDGEEVRRVSVLEAFENSDHRELGLKMAHRGGDLFHTNTTTVLGPEAEGIVPWLRPGWVLTSFRTTGVLAVVDLEAERVVHAWEGPFDRQHDPQLVEGRILLFDNTGLGDRSRVMELDPVDGSIAWQYAGPEEYPLRSWTCGTVARLPNGNTLITESEAGHVLEVTREGEVVWEYFSPFRVGQDPVYIAAIFEMVRVPRPGWVD